MTPYSLCDYTVHGILQARIVEWVAFPFSRGSSQLSDRTQVSCIAGGFFTICATREAQADWIAKPHPLFVYLTSQNEEGKIKKVKWNFTKFLIARDGTFLNRYETTVKPEDIESDIKKALNNK